MPNFRVGTRRKCQLPGERGALRSESTVEEASLGHDGQGYGLASFTKGQQSVESTDSIKAMNIYFTVKEQRQPMKLRFASMLGRENLTNEGRRQDLDFTQDSVKLLDSKNIKESDLHPKKFTHKDFLPNSLLKRQKMREFLLKSQSAFDSAAGSMSTANTETN